MATANPVAFLKEVRAELYKVTWPTKEQVFRLTGVVVVISLLVGLFIGALDLIFTKVVELLVK